MTQIRHGALFVCRLGELLVEFLNDIFLLCLGVCCRVVCLCFWWSLRDNSECFE